MCLRPLLVTTNQSVLSVINECRHELPDPFFVYSCKTANLDSLMKTITRNKINVVLTTSELFPLVCSKANVPVVKIEPTIVDFMRSLDVARRFGDVVGILGWDHGQLGTGPRGSQGFRLLDITLKCIPYSNDDEVSMSLREAARNGIKVVITEKSTLTGEAADLGIKVIPLTVSSAAVQKALRHAQSLVLWATGCNCVCPPSRDGTDLSDSESSDNDAECDDPFSRIITRSPAMIELIQQARIIAQSWYPVLISGETGTGKELLAQSIHAASPRKSCPLVTINCATLNDALVDSELFGYDKGSFTGGLKDGKDGIFQAADGGTVFLDELSSGSFALQAKLLRVIEQGEVRPVGSTTPLRVDVRVIAATNEPVEKLIATGRLRKDLYYRLSTSRLDVPPLRERQCDIGLLVESFSEKCAEEMSLPKKEFLEEALSFLEGHAWPGNVRELLNVVRRTYLMIDSTTVGLNEIMSIMGSSYQPLSLPERSDFSHAKDRGSLDSISRKVRRDAVLKVLEITNGDQAKAAEILGVSRTTIWRHVRNMKYNDTAQCWGERHTADDEVL